MKDQLYMKRYRLEAKGIQILASDYKDFQQNVKSIFCLNNAVLVNGIFLFFSSENYYWTYQHHHQSIPLSTQTDRLLLISFNIL